MANWIPKFYTAILLLLKILAPPETRDMPVAMPNEPENQVQEWNAMYAYIVKRLKSENPFEVDAERFQKELKLSDGFQQILLNARDQKDGKDPVFKMKTDSTSDNRQVFKFWK
jgi:hypothetical protein